ncbi:tRNA(Arg) A34 adenosine deaminase TadA [Bradyrhizobium barranii subsp. barranii]
MKGQRQTHSQHRSRVPKGAPMGRSEADVQDLRMMERCLELARQGVKQGELPFGAVIAFRGQVIAEATNHVSSECDVTRHAELVALSEAQKILRQKRLPDCTLYSIVEPCPMCSFPAREARIGRVVFAISSPIMGGFSRWDVLSDNGLSPRVTSNSSGCGQSNSSTREAGQGTVSLSLFPGQELQRLL